MQAGLTLGWHEIHTVMRHQPLGDTRHDVISEGVACWCAKWMRTISMNTLMCSPSNTHTHTHTHIYAHMHTTTTTTTTTTYLHHTHTHHITHRVTMTYIHHTHPHTQWHTLSHEWQLLHNNLIALPMHATLCTCIVLLLVLRTIQIRESVRDLSERVCLPVGNQYYY